MIIKYNIKWKLILINFRIRIVKILLYIYKFTFL
uniref:Uncharacterized protein n=1 Tax=Myoviridae sp. ctkfK18 TaxID=2825165 RepID=A0A8S5VGY2_9CAUD|nr:MAG TPA: hypothetical protein [Myoviridae sp. ctkfK18]